MPVLPLHPHPFVIAPTYSEPSEVSAHANGISELIIGKQALINHRHEHGIPLECLQALDEEIIRPEEVILGLRAVNKYAPYWWRRNNPTKSKKVGGKSDDWTPCAGLVPADQRFTKLFGNEQEIRNAQAAVDICLKKGHVVAIDAEIPAERIRELRDEGLFTVAGEIGKSEKITIRCRKEVDFDGKRTVEEEQIFIGRLCKSNGGETAYQIFVLDRDEHGNMCEKPYKVLAEPDPCAEEGKSDMSRAIAADLDMAAFSVHTGVHGPQDVAKLFEPSSEDDNAGEHPSSSPETQKSNLIDWNLPPFQDKTQPSYRAPKPQAITRAHRPQNLAKRPKPDSDDDDAGEPTPLPPRIKGSGAINWNPPSLQDKMQASDEIPKPELQAMARSRVAKRLKPDSDAARERSSSPEIKESSMINWNLPFSPDKMQPPDETLKSGFKAMEWEPAPDEAAPRETGAPSAPYETPASHPQDESYAKSAGIRRTNSASPLLTAAHVFSRRTSADMNLRRHSLVADPGDDPGVISRRLNILRQKMNKVLARVLRRSPDRPLLHHGVEMDNPDREAKLSAMLNSVYLTPRRLGLGKGDDLDSAVYVRESDHLRKFISLAKSHGYQGLRWNRNWERLYLNPGKELPFEKDLNRAYAQTMRRLGLPNRIRRFSEEVVNPGAPGNKRTPEQEKATIGNLLSKLKRSISYVSTGESAASVDIPKQDSVSTSEWESESQDFLVGGAGEELARSLESLKEEYPPDIIDSP